MRLPRNALVYVFVLAFGLFLWILSRQFSTTPDPPPNITCARARKVPFEWIAVINIDDQRTRWFTVLERFRLAYPALPAERWSAKTINTPQVAQKWKWYTAQNQTDYDRAIGKTRGLQSPGELALLMTYHEVIEEAKRRGYRRILVTDDDVIPSVHFEAELARLPETFKLVLLGASQWSWAVGRAFDWSVSHPGFYHPLYTDGSFATIIDHSVFDLIQWEIEKYANVLDSGAMRAVYRRYQKECFVYSPNIMIADVRTSNLRGGQNIRDRAEQMHWDLNQFSLDTPVFEPPLVSVIMTCKNCENTLQYAVDSILAQTYTRFEIIIVDDGSTHTQNITRILAGLQQQDHRIRIHRLATTIGTYNARNVGLKMAHGTIYMNHDCDDVALPTKMEVQIQPILDNRVDATLSYHIRSHASLEVFQQWKYKGMQWFLAEVNRLRVHRNVYRTFQYCCREKLGLMTFMGRMSLFEEIGPFINTSFSGDAEFMERLLCARKGLGMSHQGAAYNWHQFLEINHPFIPGVVETIPQTTLIAYGGNTMSSRVPIGGPARVRLEEKYRLEILHRYNNRTNVKYF